MLDGVKLPHQFDEKIEVGGASRFEGWSRVVAGHELKTCIENWDFGAEGKTSSTKCHEPTRTGIRENPWVYFASFL
ncbi:MAG: hypothetical protein ACRD68_05300, partial [Pyrinomonadaceae bacterium]